MQPYVKHLDVFVRTGIWFGILAGNFGHNKEYDEGERETFRRDPNALLTHAKDIEVRMEALTVVVPLQSLTHGLFRAKSMDYGVGFTLDLLHKPAPLGSSVREWPP